MREELTGVQRPTAFAYTISDVTGPMKALAARVDGQWRFEPAGAGTRISWEWQVYPASPLSALLLPVFAMFWRGYARQALESIEQILPATHLS